MLRVRLPSGAREIFFCMSLRLSLSSKQFTFKLPSCKSFHIYAFRGVVVEV